MLERGDLVWYFGEKRQLRLLEFSVFILVMEFLPRIAW